MEATPIGVGGYGSIYRAVWGKTGGGETVALKVCKDLVHHTNLQYHINIETYSLGFSLVKGQK